MRREEKAALGGKGMRVSQSCSSQAWTCRCAGECALSYHAQSSHALLSEPPIHASVCSTILFGILQQP